MEFVYGEVEVMEVGDSLGIILKGFYKSVICWEFGGSGGSFGIGGYGVKLIVNINN